MTFKPIQNGIRSAQLRDRRILWRPPSKAQQRSGVPGDDGFLLGVIQTRVRADDIDRLLIGYRETVVAAHENPVRTYDPGQVVDNVV